MIYLPVLKIFSQYNMCISSSLYHYLYIHYQLWYKDAKVSQLSAAELCPQCGVIVDSCVRYSESPHQSLCNGLQQANKPELSSVPSFFFTHLGYSLLWCKFTHYFKLHRQSGEGRVCTCRGRGWGASFPIIKIWARKGKEQNWQNPRE